jgi:Glycosyl transferase family 2
MNSETKKDRAVIAVSDEEDGSLFIAPCATSSPWSTKRLLGKRSPQTTRGWFVVLAVSFSILHLHFVCFNVQPLVQVQHNKAANTTTTTKTTVKDKDRTLTNDDGATAIQPFGPNQPPAQNLSLWRNETHINETKISTSLVTHNETAPETTVAPVTSNKPIVSFTAATNVTNVTDAKDVLAAPNARAALPTTSSTASDAVAAAAATTTSLIASTIETPYTPAAITGNNASTAINASSTATNASTFWTPLPLPRPQSEQTQPGWAAICVIMKDEERYIDDWIDYHLALGFEHIYISDNHPNYTLQPWYQERVRRETAMDGVNASTAHGRVHLRHRIVTSEPHQQYVIEPECLDHLRTLPFPPKWVMIIDGDEYLVIGDMDKYPNAVSFLTEHVPEGSLQINWIIMGSSYELQYRNEPVPQRFQKVVDKSEFLHFTKAVAVLDHVQGWFVHSAVNKEGYPYKGLGANVKITHLGGPLWHLEDDDTSIAAIYHYKYKSYEEFQYKSCRRGKASRLKANCPDPGQTGTVHDDRAWRAMQRLLPKYAEPSLPVEVADTDKAPSAALCAVVSREGDARYLSEWADYHLALGFEHIYLYDVQANFTLPSWFDQWSKNEHRDRVRVTHRFMPAERVGGSEIIYRECMNELRRQPHPPKYVMALDINDFLVVRDLDRYPNVTSFLTDHLQSGSLQISWIVMGSSNEVVHRDAPVTQRFQLAIDRGLYSEGKPAAVLDHIEGLKKHYALHKAGYKAIGMGGRKANMGGALCCIKNGDVSVAAIYHYRYKSKEEYHDEQCGSTNTTCTVEVQTGTSPDDSVWRAMTRLVSKYNTSDVQVV